MGNIMVFWPQAATGFHLLAIEEEDKNPFQTRVCRMVFQMAHGDPFPAGNRHSLPMFFRRHTSKRLRELVGPGREGKGREGKGREGKGRVVETSRNIQKVADARQKTYHRIPIIG